DIMSTDPLVVRANDPLSEVAYLLSSSKVGSAIVMDENDEIFGIFTTTDALNALVEIHYDPASL
ncbi:MAG: CBS domain-containing protein, partial [Proteobacteria bacterium]|nr:CBS domain-containing protein [Pseudomonadota bacterium]